MLNMKVHAGQVGAAGEHFVAAEIHVRGGYAVTFSGNMKGIDLLASDAEHQRKISIQVKCKTSGTWHANAVPRSPPTKPERCSTPEAGCRGPRRPRISLPAAPRPEDVRNDIHEHHSAYLSKHGGKRAHGGHSPHHAIPVSRLIDWKDRWDVLGILPDGD